MIKLNNKNITYVALADSNNSVKGVKEIWYADTNNSVKLVYRRKDALIDGEDYEKYHWLVGDADAYINTLKYYRPYDDSVQMTFRDNLYPNRESKYNKYNTEEQIWGACETNNLKSVLIRSYVSGGSAPNSICNNIIDGSTADSAVSWGTYATQNHINESPEHSLYISSVNNEDKYYFIYNGNTKDNLPTRYTLPELVQQDVRIFYSGIHTSGYFNGSFFNFIHYRNNVEITHLIPCKLLKPVPKWLDANGIRRQVGECGMIDLVSGKFYGNVNSVGTFTVENYYERKEWLVGDGSAFLSTTNGLTGLNSVEWELSGNGQAVLNSFRLTTGAAQFVSDLSYVDGSIGKIGIYDNNRGYFWTTKLDVNTLRLVSGTTIKAITINDVDLSNPNYQWDGFFLLQFINRAAGYKVSKVTVDGVERYIPCTLTMDLPASMDANNIARTKGTSGMWDLVSDRFYGNVANSGTFKAVNLAEGVDYEVHQYLNFTNEGTKTMTFMSLPIESDVVSFKRIYIDYTNNSIFTTGGNRYSYGLSNSTMLIRVWDYDTQGVSYSKPISTETTIRDIKSTSTSLTINDVEITKYGFPIDSVVWRCLSSHSCKNSSIIVDGIERYIPCKLLRSIPAKYDANGIARQAGECGMYDTVNDVFYGNVASSGTFSVSD